MKKKNPHQYIYILFSLFIISLYSCKEKNHTVELLAKAQAEAEDNPEKALQLLDSIPNPEQLDKDNYMRYIVTKVQAKFKTYQDVSQDTIIFEACKYFDSKDDPNLSALAHYYASAVYFDSNQRSKEFEEALVTKRYAELAENNILLAKSIHTIGALFYDLNLYDSCAIYYKKSAVYYNKVTNNINYQADLLRAIGLTYGRQQNYDSAYYYYNKGLQISKQTNNRRYKTTFTHLLGLTYQDKKDYTKAANYLHTAFHETQNPEEYRRIALSLLNFYKSTNQLDSAKIYSKILEDNLDKITYPYTLQSCYKHLANYYEKIGNYPKVLYYNERLRDADKLVYDSRNAIKLAEVKINYESTLHQKEVEHIKVRDRFLFILGFLIFTLITLTIYFRLKSVRERNKHLKTQLATQNIQLEADKRIMRQQSQGLNYMHGIYRNIITEWRSIDRDIQKLAKELGTTEEPELYKRIKKIMENFRTHTNNELINLAKDFLSNQPYGAKTIELLEDKELLLFMLYYSGYKRFEVALLLGVNPIKSNMIQRKLGLKNKLIQAGMPENEIQRILFDEDN